MLKFSRVIKRQITKLKTYPQNFSFIEPNVKEIFCMVLETNNKPILTFLNWSCLLWSKNWMLISLWYLLLEDITMYLKTMLPLESKSVKFSCVSQNTNNYCHTTHFNRIHNIVNISLETLSIFIEIRKRRSFFFVFVVINIGKKSCWLITKSNLRNNSISLFFNNSSYNRYPKHIVIVSFKI